MSIGTSADDLARAKRAVRREVLARRDALSDEERRRHGAQIVARLLVLEEVRAAHSIMAFWSFGSEVPTIELLEALHDRGVRTALPRIATGRGLEIRTWAPGEATTETSFGAREPADGDRLDPAELDVVIVPAVAFDHSGRRIGYGGGYYDRLLPQVRTNCVRIGIGFSVQVVDGDLPHGELDRGVALVVTEAETIRART